MIYFLNNRVCIITRKYMYTVQRSYYIAFVPLSYSPFPVLTLLPQILDGLEHGGWGL